MSEVFNASSGIAAQVLQTPGVSDNYAINPPLANTASSSSSSQNDPERMELTAQERARAIAIKTTIEMMADLDNLSDFWYAQLALVCSKGDDNMDNYSSDNNVDAAVRMAIQLQELREEHGIADTREDALKEISNLHEVFRNCNLGFGYCEESQNYVGVYDLSRFRVTGVDSPRDFRRLFASCYYSFHAVNADFAAIRQGSIGVADCHSVGWSHYRQDLKTMVTLYRDLVSVYPCKTRLLHCNTGVVFGTLASILKKALPKEFRDRVEYNCRWMGDDGQQRLDSIFLVPTPKEAQKRVMANQRDAIQRRYDNEASFSLE